MVLTRNKELQAKLNDLDARCTWSVEVEHVGYVSGWLIKNEDALELRILMEYVHDGQPAGFDTFRPAPGFSVKDALRWLEIRGEEE